jgi:hypothetical protein
MEATIKGGKLIITIDFSEKGAPSASGKTTVHASN